MTHGTTPGTSVRKPVWKTAIWFLVSSGVGGMVFVLTLVADAIGLLTLGIPIVWWRVIGAACLLGGGLSVLWKMQAQFAILRDAVESISSQKDFNGRLTEAFNRALPVKPTGKMGSLQQRAEALSIEIREFTDEHEVRIDLQDPQKSIGGLMESLDNTRRIWGERFAPRVIAIVDEFAAINITSKELEKVLRKGASTNEFRRIGEMIGALSIRLQRMN